jgi:hypothetical protein
MTDKARESWLLEHEMIPDELRAKASDLRDYFISLKRKEFPAWNFGKRDDKSKTAYWESLYIKAVDLGHSPKTLIDKAFEAYGPSALPSHAVQTTTIQKSDELTAEKVVAVKEDMEWCARRLYVIRQNTDRSIEDIITDSREAFTSVFRWCIANHMNMPEVAQLYAKQAMRLLNLKAYREVYMEFFPEVIANARKEATNAG